MHTKINSNWSPSPTDYQVLKMQDTIYNTTYNKMFMNVYVNSVKIL